MLIDTYHTGYSPALLQVYFVKKKNVYFGQMFFGPETYN